MDSKISKEEVLSARSNYLKVREAYHNASQSTVRMAVAPDGYRGDMCCVRFLDDVEVVLQTANDGSRETDYDIYKNDIKIGLLTETCGNNGKGKLASSQFTPVKGVKVIWSKVQNDDEGEGDDEVDNDES